MADEVAGADDGGVRGVDPGRPGVGVPDGNVDAQALQHAACLGDLRGQHARGGVVAVEVFAADGDADDPRGAVLLDGGFEGGGLGGVVGGVFGLDCRHDVLVSLDVCT